MEKVKYPRFLRVFMLVTGFLGVAILGCPALNWGTGFATAVWVLSFLGLASSARSRKDHLVNAAVFCVGYLVRFFDAVDVVWLYALLFPGSAIVIYMGFLLYSRILYRWDRFWTTLAFPLLWLVGYLLGLLVRFPALIRVDVMFTDLKVLIQAENLLGTIGFSCLLVWMMALLHYAIRNRVIYPALVSSTIYLLLLVFGIIYLYPNNAFADSVKVAYTTGPYVGDYIHYEDLTLDKYRNNMMDAARKAAEGGAKILVFSEEAFAVDAWQEEEFLAGCCTAAAENGIHMLVGLDITNPHAKGSNKLVWISAEGEILGSYEKTKLIPVLESAYQAGNGNIPSHTIIIDGQELTVSYLICYDSNFSNYVRGIDPETDILFLPSWDWKGVTALHTRICRPLAVENRVSILKVTYDGESLVIDPDGSIVHSTNTDEVGFGPVHVVDVPYTGEQGLISAKPELEGYIFAIFATELMGVMVCLVLLYGSIFENKLKTTRNRLYSVIVFSAMVGMGADALSWTLDGCARLTPVLYVSTVLSLVMTFVITGQYIAYLTAYIRERHAMKSTLQNVYMVFATVAILMIIYFTITGQMFTYVNGKYVVGAYYDLYVYVNVATVLLCIVAFYRYSKLLSRHDIVATSLYIVFPAVAAIINTIYDEFSYAYPAVTLSLVVIFVMIQSERVDQLQQEEQISSHMALHDAMTGLLNRRAYDKRISALSAGTEMTGVIFSDVNGLKYTNDHFGHEAGDKLLKDYAALLCSQFRKDEIFRISGDEFVIIISSIEQPAFEDRAKKLHRSLGKNGTMVACIGMEFGSGGEIMELLRKAEEHMYFYKEEYHKLHPETTRGK